MIKEYKAVRFLTESNFLFRDKLTLDTDRKILLFQKRSSLIGGFTNRSIMFNRITVVKLEHRVELFMFSRLCIESGVGNEILSISGLVPEEAKEIKYLLDNLR